MNWREALREWFADPMTCVGFFTRLPVPHGTPSKSFADSLRAAPIAGLVIAICGALVFWLASRLGLPSTVAAALALSATMLVTGCLHEDGLADVADGFGGGKTRERKLEIMRDSRIGTYGVAALALSILLRWSALAALLTPSDVFAALVAAHMAARGLLPAFIASVSAARPDGLSANVGEIASTSVLIAAVLGFLALLLLGLGAAIVMAIVLAILLVLLKRLCERQIGGQTGDVLGLVEQASEITVMLAACIAFR